MHLKLRTTLILFVLITSIVSVEAAPTPTRPLFSKGSEIFNVQDQNGKVPQFRVFDDTPAERALAAAVVTALNSQPEVQPKIPVKDHVDLRIEKLTFEPTSKAKKELAVYVNVSGHELELPKKVNTAQFLAGEMIELNFPKSDRDLSLFSIESDGKIRFRFDAAKNEIAIQEAAGRVAFDSPIAGQGEEKVKFSGKGIRQKL